VTGKLSVSGSARVGQAAARPLRVALLTREYPPEVYGGAGVHVTYLARELAPLVDLVVHCQGADRIGAVAHQPWDKLADANQALRVISTDLSMAAAVGAAELVHSHTWYANLAGHLAAMLYGIPHVVTMHSLEPLRPWKAEQLGGGYALSSWCEREAATSAAAVVAVSEGMRADITAAYPEIDPERIRVIRNGIDTSEYVADPQTDVLERFGVDLTRPYVIFVGRITRQKGVPVLLRAASRLIPDAQLVLCAGAPDTAELLAEVTELVDGLQAERSGVMLQNRGFGFRVERGHPNCIAPHKRPMHTIIPGMLMRDGQVQMPFGVMGGHYQPMGHSWFLTNFLRYGLDIQEAIDLPRLFPLHGKLQIERGIPADVVARLTAMGHVPELAERPHGGGQAIWIDRDRGCLVAGSEPRKDGLALGY